MSNNKKIAVICNYSLKPERIGGMDRFFVAYDQACKKIGFSVDWYFSNCKPHGFYKDLNVFATENTTAEEEYLRQHNFSRRYDVVITHFIELCTSFFKYIKAQNNPYIIAVDHNPRPLEGFPLKKRIKNRIKGNFYGRYIDCFVGVSKYTVDQIIKDYGIQLLGKMHLVYNGVETKIYKQRNEDNFGKMIVASHLRKSKGIQDLIDAVYMLSEQHKKLLRIDIYGEGPMEMELKAKVKAYNLDAQIIFKGSSSKLPELLKEYSFLLQPTYMECFSLSILESLAANVPVITTPVGGNLEVISDNKNGLIFKPADIRKLSNILERILQNDLKIDRDVRYQIEQDFPLGKMVNGHLKLLPCT